MAKANPDVKKDVRSDVPQNVCELAQVSSPYAQLAVALGETRAGIAFQAPTQTFSLSYRSNFSHHIPYQTIPIQSV